MQASACAANASLSSIRSMSARLKPARCKALCVAATGPKPMRSGAHPAMAMLRIRASRGKPCSRAKVSLHTNVMDAPSVKGDAVPAVTVPCWSKAGLRLAKASSVVSARMQPSCVTLPTTMISSLKCPAACAAAAFCWLCSAKASCAARLMANVLARYSAVCPMLK